MARIATRAIVLRVVDFGESDRVVHLLSPDLGRTAAIAKGARRSRKRFPGTLDLFNLLRVQIERRPGAAPLARLEQAVLVEAFAGLRSASTRFALASYLIELLDRLAPEGGPAADLAALFGFAERALRAIETRRPDRRLRVLLELRALEALGLRPELERCVRCGRTVGDPPAGAGLAGFHVAEGGPLCGACGVRLERDALVPVHLGTLRALAGGLRLELERLDRLALGPAALDEAARLIARFQRFHVGLELRSERFLGEILPATRAGAA
jgi:DNA repair protein RecO (recombination protein O)